MLKNYFQNEPRDDARKIREKLTSKLLSLDRALEPALPVFLALLDVAVEDLEWAKLDPLQRRRQTLDTLKAKLPRDVRDTTSTDFLATKLGGRLKRQYDFTPDEFHAVFAKLAGLVR